MTRLFLCLFVLVIPATFSAQSPPPAPSGTKNRSTVPPTWPSVKKLPAFPGFRSLRGRFQVGLPSSLQAFESLTPKQMGNGVSGQGFTWKFAEAEVTGLFLDFLPLPLTGTADDLARITASFKKQVTDKRPASKLVAEENAVVGGVPSTYYLFDHGDEGFASSHVFLDGKRVYRFDAKFKERSIGASILAGLKTFQVIPQEEIEAELRRIHAGLKPASLPQTPVLSRPTSDAQDEGLKGKVKEVVEETEDLSGTWSLQGRHRSSVEYYDQNGSLTQRDSYDSEGIPFEITVFGYVGGKRVSKSNTAPADGITRISVDPPTPAAAGRTRRSDPSYEYSYENKYSNGRLVESQMMLSNGQKYLRYVYKHSPGLVEELVYTEDGKLNQRYLSVLDIDGNEIEQTDFGLENFDLYGDRRYKHGYEFDAVGNWVKKITSKEVKENGITSWQPDHISHRTIVYH